MDSSTLSTSTDRPGEGALPPDIQSELDRIAQDEKYAGGLLYNSSSVIKKQHAEAILMAAARKSPRRALYQFSQFDAPFAGRLFEKAAQADPLGFLMLAMHDRPPSRFDKIRSLIWKEIGWDPQQGGTLWGIEGQFLPRDVIADFQPRLTELFREFQDKLHQVLRR